MVKKKAIAQPAAEIYARETLFLQRAREILNNEQPGSVRFVNTGWELGREYERLLKDTIKLTRIGDLTQKKLRGAREKIEAQNVSLRREKEKSEQALLALRKNQALLALELSKAADYVKSLIPPPLKAGPVRVDWSFVPSEQLGGDSMGFHWIDGENFAIYLLDVCDHGVGPALLSVSVLNMLRSESLIDTDFLQPEQVLSALNENFKMKEQHNLYFTMWYGVFNTKTRRLRFASAGHPPALLIENDSRLTQLRTRNYVIGGLSGFKYRSETVTVPPESDLFVFSDGVYEVDRPDGNLWTLGELQNYLQTLSTKRNSKLDILYGFLIELHGSDNLDDDFSIMRLTFN